MLGSREGAKITCNHIIQNATGYGREILLHFKKISDVIRSDALLSRSVY